MFSFYVVYEIYSAAGASVEGTGASSFFSAVAGSGAVSASEEVQRVYIR